MQVCDGMLDIVYSHDFPCAAVEPINALHERSKLDFHLACEMRRATGNLRPHISNSKCFFKVRASPVVASKKPPVPARFDTALLIEKRALYNGKGISGLRVGEIKAIPTLPSRFGAFPHPLLYIHWFRPLQTFDNDLRTFRLVRLSRQHQPNAAVLPADLLLHPCHLIPRFSRDAVVNEPEQFYPNKYIDLELFERLS